MTVFYNDGNVGPDDLAVEGVRANWTTDHTLDRSWKLVGADEFETDGDRIPCSGQPEDHTTEWVDGEFDCADTTVEQTRTVTPYVLDGNFEWVFDEAHATTETRTRDLTGSEQFPCDIPTSPIRAIPVDPTVTGPDCTTAGTVVLPALDRRLRLGEAGSTAPTKRSPTRATPSTRPCGSSILVI